MSTNSAPSAFAAAPPLAKPSTLQAPSTGAAARGAMKLPSKYWRRLGMIAVPWLFLTGLFLPSALIFDGERSQPNGWRYMLLNYACCFMFWALYTPLIGILVKNHPLRWPPVARSVVVHLGSALSMTAVHVSVMAGFDFVVPPSHPVSGYAHNLFEMALGRGPFDLMIYASTVACFSAWNALQDFHQRERTIVQAQLDALRAQIEPHFLFNALNAISELVYRDPPAADRAITQLSSLLRQVVDGRAHQQSLGEELAMSREYLSIQQILLGERLQVSWQVPQDLLDAQVPTLLLQPLLENAIRHGVAQLRRGGTIEIRASRDRDRLQLCVQNAGPPRPESLPPDGTGLSNTRARLQALHNTAAKLDLSFSPEGGASALIELPLQRSVAT